ncbi:MAG: hypothetical protein HY023_18970 [Chloroflexi bacterium]|nr:hypothetical protein [Chloroflexota bacterium]
MLSLRRVFLDYDLGLLRIIAGLWGVELAARDARAAADELAEALLRPDAAREVLDSLPPEARAALENLLAAGGRLPVAQFTRQFGEVRPMGPARRDREQAWLAPASPVEALWYRGLIGRAFAEARPTPQEFFFVPSDLAPLLPQPTPAPPAVPGEAVPAPESPLIAGSAIVDDTCTALAYLQNEKASLPLQDKHRAALGGVLLQPASLEFILHLIAHLGLAVGTPFKPQAAQARPFLEAPRAQQHQRLAETWQTDPTWNDLTHVEGLIAEAITPPNDPLAARQAILSLLAQIPIGEWWSLESFALAMKDRAPDFQRPAGDYDSWYIRDTATGEYLRGFENWDRVDGALIRHIICGPMHWLGLVSIGTASTDHGRGAEERGGGGESFQLTRAARALLHGARWPADSPPGKIIIRADGALAIPRGVNSYDRFTAARFTDWESPEADRAEVTTYHYRISACSLARARDQSVAVRHILAFLNKAGENPVPKSLVAALERWEVAGTEAVFDEMMVLRVKSADIIERLNASPKTRRCLGETLGPLAVEVKRADWEKLREAMVEMGMLADSKNV